MKYIVEVKMVMPNIPNILSGEKSQFAIFLFMIRNHFNIDLYQFYSCQVTSFVDEKVATFRLITDKGKLWPEWRAEVFYIDYGNFNVDYGEGNVKEMKIFLNEDKFEVFFASSSGPIEKPKYEKTGEFTVTEFLIAESFLEKARHFTKSIAELLKLEKIDEYELND